jgi:hypothetical protein
MPFDPRAVERAHEVVAAFCATAFALMVAAPFACGGKWFIALFGG